MKCQTARRCCWQFLLQQAEHEADLSEGPRECVSTTWSPAERGMLDVMGRPL
jgi:hypothetical protein